MKNYKISEIARLSGVSVKAIRVYEQKELLTPVRHFESNYRLYSSQSITKVKNIKFLQSLGFSLNEIAVIHTCKNISKNDLKNKIIDQLNITNKKLSDLEQRKKILLSIIEKIKEGELNPSTILTTKEKDIFMGITTGFPKLDQLLTGEKDDLFIVVAARPGMGKTALTLHMAHSLLEQRRLPIYFYSTELSYKQWVERLAVQQYKIDECEGDYFQTIKQEIEAKYLFYRFNENIDISEIWENVTTLKQPLGAIVIDYYQDISGDAQLKSQKLKELALIKQCPMIVISTVDQKVEQREDNTPRLTDINDYEAMDKYVDKFMIVSRDPRLKLSEVENVAKVDVYSKDVKKSEHVNLIWNRRYCGYTDSL